MSKLQTTRFEIGRLVTYGAAAFQAYHMGRAFYVYDPDGWHLGTVNFGGSILGAIVNVIVAMAAVKLPGMAATFASLKELLPKASRKADKKEERARSRALKTMTLAKKKNLYAQFGFILLLSFSALLVGPALYMLWSKTMPFHPFFIGFLAGVAAVVPDIAITVGGFVTNDGQTSSEAKSANAGAKSASESVASASAGAKGAICTPAKSDRSATEMRTCDLGCGMSYRWPQGKGAHMKKYHAELCIVKGTPAFVALPLKDQQKAEK